MEYDGDGSPVLTIGGPVGAEPQLVIGDVLPGWDQYVVDYRVGVIGDGLRAERSVSLSYGGDGLPDFFAQVGEDFRGWEGTRHWRSLEGDLTIEASWASRGHVTLRPTLRSHAWWLPHRWEATTEFDVEAGAEMTALAGRAAAFFRDVPG